MDKVVRVNIGNEDQDAVALEVVGIVDQSHLFNSRDSHHRIERLTLRRT
jgi:hypothetical protein